MSDGLRARVERELASLSDGERRVALTVVEDLPQIGFMSATEIGQSAGVSDATVVRTAQRLGFAGLPQLKQAAAAELRDFSLSDRLRRSLRAASAGVLGETVDQHAEALARLTAVGVAAEFEAAVEVLAEGARIVLAATGPSAPIAEYGAMTLARIGWDTRTLVRSGTAAADDVAALRSGDALVLLAYEPVRAHVGVLIDRAVELDVPIVLLTDTVPEPAGRSVVLRTGRGVRGASASHVATVSMLEALALGVAGKAPQRSTDALDDLRRLRSRLARGESGA